MTVASQLKQTIASLKGAKSTLKIYLLQSQDKDTKSTYEEAVAATDEVVKNLENRLKTIEFEEPQYKEH